MTLGAIYRPEDRRPSAREVFEAQITLSVLQWGRDQLIAEISRRRGASIGSSSPAALCLEIFEPPIWGSCSALFAHLRLVFHRGCPSHAYDRTE